MPAELSTTESCCMGMTKECQLWKLSQPVYECADCYQKWFLCIILSSMQIQYQNVTAEASFNSGESFKDLKLSLL